ncbi:hypothetical protein VE02_05557 [Pseudogymnoascus sp. 03VT05]|nr:hypothetical protein VE02_05557 [Pseudogymnoascus sp. 03VT05]
MPPYSIHTISQLKAILRDRDLHVSGNKQVLIQRLEDDDRLKAAQGRTDGQQTVGDSSGSELESNVEDDGDYNPGAQDSDGDSEDEAPDEDEDDEDNASRNGSDLSLSDIEEESYNFCEVVLPDGTIERIEIPENLSDEAEEGRLDKEIRNDPVYEHLTERRRMRMEAVIIVGTENPKMREQKELDFSDSAPTNKLPAGKVAFIPCLAGRFVPIRNKPSGPKRYKELTDEELNKAETVAGAAGIRCTCEICEKRRLNNDNLTEGELRSGKICGWNKYGVGRVLGSGSAGGIGRSMLVG